MELEWSSFRGLTEAIVKAIAPASAGVYLLWVQLKNKKWRCYYVGQAENLERRLLDRLSDGEANEGIKDNVANHTSSYECAQVGKQSDRDGIEKYLYDHYTPECNKADPGGTPVEVNGP